MKGVTVSFSDVDRIRLDYLKPWDLSFWSRPEVYGQKRKCTFSKAGHQMIEFLTHLLRKNYPKSFLFTKFTNFVHFVSKVDKPFSWSLFDCDWTDYNDIDMAQSPFGFGTLAPLNEKLIRLLFVCADRRDVKLCARFCFMWK